MALYAGIDVGKYKHEVTFLSESGEQVGNPLVFDNSQRGLEKLFGQALKNDPERIIFGLEATGHYWLPLYAQLTAAGYDVKVINPIQSDSLRNLYIRVTKNDRKDSFLIAEVLRFGRYTETKVAKEPLIQLRELSRMRVEFQQSVAGIKTRIIGLLDRFFPEFERCFSTPCSATAQEVLKSYPTPEELADCSLNELKDLIEKASRGRHGLDKAVKLKDAAAKSFGITFGLDAFRLEIRLLLEQLSFIETQVEQLDRYIEELMKEQNLILSVPGVGPVLGAAILGEIGDISRFGSAKKLTAYAGLDATVYQSGQFEGSRAHISKRGSPYLRRALWMAAHIARMHDRTFKDFYELKLSQGKHPNQALGAVATKLCHVIYAVLSKNVPYDPNWNAVKNFARGIDLT